MGAVYRAQHAMLDERRAIKVLLPEWKRSAAIAERFVNEARAAARMKHRNVVRVHDVGQLATGELYIMYDYVEGGTLADLLASQSGPMAIDRIVHVGVETCAGLRAAHALGIV